MKVVIITILSIILFSLLITILWPAMMVTLGAVIGFFSLKKLLRASATGEKFLYGGLTTLGGLIILTHLRGAIVLVVIGALIYFLTSEKRQSKTRKNDTFDYPYKK